LIFQTKEAIEEFGSEPMDWRLQGAWHLRGDGLALDYRIQEIGDGMEGVGFSDLDRLKEKDLL
jgi:hypothetical protein